MERVCAQCGQAYAAQRSTSRYCSQVCGRKARRAQARAVRAERKASDLAATVTPIGAPTAPPAKDVPLSVEDRARRELRSLVDTALGQMCLQAARRLDEGRDTSAAGVASLMKRLEDMLATAAGILSSGTAEEADDDDPIAYLEQRGAERRRAWESRLVR